MIDHRFTVKFTGPTPRWATDARYFSHGPAAGYSLRELTRIFRRRGFEIIGRDVTLPGGSEVVARFEPV